MSQHVNAAAALDDAEFIMQVCSAKVRAPAWKDTAGRTHIQRERRSGPMGRMRSEFWCDTCKGIKAAVDKQKLENQKADNLANEKHAKAANLANEEAELRVELLRLQIAQAKGGSAGGTNPAKKKT